MFIVSVGIDAHTHTKYILPQKALFQNNFYFSGLKQTEMFRLWVREFKDTRMLKDVVIEDDTNDTRTHKIFHALEKACHELDLAVPIWLDKNIEDFKRTSKCRFRKESFIEEVPFDFLEIQIIEEDPSY